MKAFAQLAQVEMRIQKMGISGMERSLFRVHCVCLLIGWGVTIGIPEECPGDSLNS